MPIGLVRALGSILLIWAGQVAGAVVQYQSTDLPDLIPGQDRWSYRYLVTGSFTAFQGLNVLFPAQNYQDLQITQADPLDWFTLITQPDVSLPADGILTASALTDTNAISVPFELDFTWLGSGVPGAQSVEIFDSDFSLIATGFTAPLDSNSIPEPSSLLLAAVGLALIPQRIRS